MMSLTDPKQGLRIMTQADVQEIKVYCSQLGECTATYYLVLLLNENERLRKELLAYRQSSALEALKKAELDWTALGYAPEDEEVREIIKARAALEAIE